MKVSCLFILSLIFFLHACANSNIDRQLLASLESDHAKFQEDHQKLQQQGVEFRQRILKVFPGVEAFTDKDSELYKSQPDAPKARLAINLVTKLRAYDSHYAAQIEQLHTMIRQYQADSLSTEEVRSAHQTMTNEVASIHDAYRQFAEYVQEIEAPATPAVPGQ